MPDRPIHTLLRRLRRAVGPDPGAVPDAQLVQRFVAARDGAAFETLVWRHGPMVLAACRRLLRHEQDAEDAFQATFLALARKAGTIGRREAVAGWLHRVAGRAAQHLRTSRARYPALDEPALRAVAAPPEPDPVWADLRPVLDEEIGWLPRKYREAFVLCCLEGLTDAEAARQLGCPPGTVVSRLSRARQRLRQRLASRGLVLTAGALAVALETVAAPPASAALLRLAVRIGSVFLAGSGAADVLPPHVIALTEGVLNAMSMTRLKIFVTTCLVVAALGAAVGLGAYRGEAAAMPADPAPQGAPPAQGKNDAPPAKADTVLAQPTALPLHGQKGAARAVAFAPDGKKVATAGTDQTVCVWDADTGRQTLMFDLPRNAAVRPGGVAFSPDGAILVAGIQGAVLAWDAATGRKLWQAGEFGGTVAFSPDSKVVITVAEVAGEVCEVAGYQAATGKVFLEYNLSGGRALPCSAFSQDGKLFAIGSGAGGSVHLMDAEGGLLRRWNGRSPVTGMAFLPDGSGLLAADEGKSIRRLNLADGKEEAAFSAAEAVRTMALSPDGRLAAVAGQSGKVYLWDPTSGKAERQFAASEGAIDALAIAPDGKRIVTAGEDGAVVWDLTRDERPLPKDFRLTEKELNALWADLAGHQGGKAYAALRMLRTDPVRSVPFLRERLKPQDSGVNEKKVKGLIADLDSDNFEMREKATTELEKLGKTVEPALRQALAAEPALETKRRLESLLEPLGGNMPLTPEQQRDVRAVRVLEQVGTPEAKKLLEVLLKESPGWWVTQEAKAALERLAPRDKKP